MWSPSHVEDVCRFVELMPHIEGDWGSPTIVLEDWQVFILGCVFGWRRRDDQRIRRFTTVYQEVARKNAKSAIASALTLYTLTCEGERGAQVKTAATTGDQARIIFDIAKAMAEATPAFLEAYGVECFAKSITTTRNGGGSLKPINAKASTQDGLNPHAAFLDELHAHKSRALFDVLKSATGARRNPLSWYVTTAGYDTIGVCFEQRKLATAILEQAFEADHYCAFIFTIDDGDDEFDESVWAKANPNLGVSVFVDTLRSYALEAKRSPDTLAEFRTKRLNVWIGAASAYLNTQAYSAGCLGGFELDEVRDLPCYMGLDLASKLDLAALVMLWTAGDEWYLLPKFYVPEDSVSPRSERDGLPYLSWVNQGLLTATPGPVTDYVTIENDIREACSTFDVQEIAFDPWNAFELSGRLIADQYPMIEFRQGFASYNAPMKELQAAVIAGKLRTRGHPILRWMAGNLVARRDANDNVAPDKKKSGEKIDGWTAALMAKGRQMVSDESPPIPGDYAVVTA